MLAVSATSCKKEIFNAGAGVSFSMSNRGIDTKATYGSLVDGTQKIQMIDWTLNDRIAICCDCAEAESPVAPKQGPVVYKVAGVSAKNNQSIASVVVDEENKFIQWGGNHQHTFYCVYPAPEETGTVTKTFSSNVVTGSIPETQSQQENLKFYMLLYGKSAYDAPHEKVDVDFYPLTTCIDFKIKFDVSMTVTDIALVSSKGEILSGDFSYDFDSGVCTSTGGTNKVMVSYGEGGCACTTETELSFKLFVKPCDDIVEPYFAVNYFDEEGVACFTKTQLKYKEEGEHFKFVKSHKTNVTGLLVKEGLIITSFDEPTLLKWNEESNDLYLDDELETVFQIISGMPEGNVINVSGKDAQSDIISLKIKSCKQFKRSGVIVEPIKPSIVIGNTDVLSYNVTGPVDGVYTYKFSLKENPMVTTTETGLDNKLKTNSQVCSDLSYYKPASNSKGDTQETANCYIVNAPGTYTFPAYYGNKTKYDSYDGTKPISSISSAYLLTGKGFDDCGIKDVKYSEGNIQFTITPDDIRPGNAVIVCENSSKTVLWSWHIWVTSESFAPSNGFMPFALGAKYSYTTYFYSYPERECKVDIKVDGIDKEHFTVSQSETTADPAFKTVRSDSPVGCTYYQWGRKDPLLDPKSQITGWNSYSIDQAIQNPGSILIPNSQENWYSSTDVELWGREGGYSPFTYKKKIFDSSPVGYRVPGQEELKTYNGSYVAFGYFYTTKIEDNAYYWTASCPDNNSYLHLAFAYLSKLPGSNYKHIDWGNNENYYKRNAFSILPIAY